MTKSLMEECKDLARAEVSPDQAQILDQAPSLPLLCLWFTQMTHKSLLDLYWGIQTKITLPG